MSRITFIIGGARSGKSSYALARASEIPGSKVYVATAQAFDDEMKERIEKHRKERGKEWDTYEEPLRLSNALKTVSRTYRAVVIDCLTLWLSNLLCSDADVARATDAFVESLHTAADEPAHVFIVSNEVGMGIVPDNEMARKFRDMAGKLNQRVAGVADEVYLLAAGLPLRLK
jgi:adenosylcobinamide kinase/adenosylcobinamide-phosphate guanylyltransferase